MMDLASVQQTFIDYIKQPSSPLPQGTDARRMNIYRQLFFNNIDGFISSAFPVLKSLYQRESWQALIQDFFVCHDCKTPIFVEIANEFLLFLQSEYQLKQDDPPFLIELAHYEYMELVVSIALDNPLQAGIDLTAMNSAAIDSEESELRNLGLCLSDSAKVLQYSFDVQRITADYRPEVCAQSPQLFCLYRDEHDEVIFLQLQALTAQVLGYLAEYECVTFDDLCTWLQNTYPHMDGEVLVHGCEQMLKDLAGKGVVKQYLG